MPNADGGVSASSALQWQSAAASRGAPDHSWLRCPVDGTRCCCTGAVTAYARRPSAALWSDARAGWELCGAVGRSPSALSSLLAGYAGGALSYVAARRATAWLGVAARISSAQPVLGTVVGAAAAYACGALAADAAHRTTRSAYAALMDHSAALGRGGAREATRQQQRTRRLCSAYGCQHNLGPPRGRRQCEAQRCTSVINGSSLPFAAFIPFLCCARI